MKNIIEKLKTITSLVIGVPLALVFVPIYFITKGKKLRKTWSLSDGPEKMKDVATFRLMHYTKALSEDIQECLQLEHMPTVIDIFGWNDTTGGMMYLISKTHKRADMVRELMSDGVTLIDGVWEDEEFLFPIFICTDTVYDRYCRSHNLWFKFKMIHILIHEITHFKQLCENYESFINDEYIDANKDYVAYKEQVIETEANRMASKFIRRNFLKILFL